MDKIFKLNKKQNFGKLLTFSLSQLLDQLCSLYTLLATTDPPFNLPENQKSPKNLTPPLPPPKNPPSHPSQAMNKDCRPFYTLLETTGPPYDPPENHVTPQKSSVLPLPGDKCRL